MRTRYACAPLPLAVLLTLTTAAAAQPPRGCLAPGASSDANMPRPDPIAERLAALRAGARYALSKIGIPAELRLFDPDARGRLRRAREEEDRRLGFEWQRIWFTDQPSHLTPERVRDHQLSKLPAICWPY